MKNLKIKIFDGKEKVDLKVECFKKGWLEISIYDLEVNKIKEIFSGELEEGIHNFSWDKTNQQGKKVRSGIYLIGVREEGEIKVNFENLIFIL